MFVLGVCWCSLRSGMAPELCYVAAWIGRAHLSHVAWGPRAGGPLPHTPQALRGQGGSVLGSGCPESWFTRGRAG